MRSRCCRRSVASSATRLRSCWRRLIWDEAFSVLSMAHAHKELRTKRISNGAGVSCGRSVTSFEWFEIRERAALERWFTLGSGVPLGISGDSGSRLPEREALPFPSASGCWKPLGKAPTGRRVSQLTLFFDRFRQAAPPRARVPSGHSEAEPSSGGRDQRERCRVRRACENTDACRRAGKGRRSLCVSSH